MTAKNSKDKIWKALVILKYLFSVFITFLAFRTCHSRRYLLISLAEFTVIVMLSNVLLSKNRYVGHGVHFLLLLLYNAQTLVLYFSGSFTSLIMLTNLVFVKDLQGKFSLYLKLIFPMAVLTLIPAKAPEIKKNAAACLTALSAIGILGIGIVGRAQSPLFNVYLLYQEQRAYSKMVKEAESLKSDGTEFYSPQIADYVRKPDVLGDTPNIVLIFAEGLSENIIHDDRGIMPGLLEFESEVLRFDNYYNHTFATLRGLIGQLYSGYQLENFDTNSLISIQSILKSRGYQTGFINTEPMNDEFTEYLDNLGFDEILTDMERVSSNGSYIHDRDAFELLFDTIEEEHASGVPFFTAIYTFGTHMSLDTADEQYGDGTNDLLNRFYDLDVQFARFLKKFKESPLFEDTILIFTADHATYADDDFLSTFPEYDRISPCLDAVPLYFYYSGVMPEAVEANGRNSLDLAPTLLDYLDISAPNYFLGQSLFAPPEAFGAYDTIFHESASVLSSANGEIRELTESDYSEFRTLLVKYSSAKGVTDIVPISEDYISVHVSEDGKTMEITLKSKEEYENVWFPVWSDADWQDDLIWHEAVKNGDGSYSCTVDLSEHSGKGIYYAHAYEGASSPENLIAVSWVYVSEGDDLEEDSAEDALEEAAPEESGAAGL